MKIIYTILLTGTLLSATEFTNRENGEFAGLGFAIAQKIDMNDKTIKKSNKYTMTKNCRNNLKEYIIFKSYKDKYEEALDFTIMQCVENLEKMNSSQ